MQWLQDPSQSNVDSLNNVRREASRHFRNKKKKYLKSKMEEHETNSKIEGRGDLFTGSHSMLSRWRNHFSQLYKIH